MSNDPLNRILFVEDDPDIQEVARMALELVGGFFVATASSGQEAIAMLDIVKPQLILLDVMMPEMDGPTTLQKIREIPAWADTPIVFLTARIQEQDRLEYQEMGATGFIAKPFDPMTLADNIKKIWQEYHRSRQS